MHPKPRLDWSPVWAPRIRRFGRLVEHFRVPERRVSWRVMKHVGPTRTLLVVPMLPEVLGGADAIVNHQRR